LPARPNIITGMLCLVDWQHFMPRLVETILV
jgi:hypothetical protein